MPTKLTTKDALFQAICVTAFVLFLTQQPQAAITYGFLAICIVTIMECHVFTMIHAGGMAILLSLLYGVCLRDFKTPQGWIISLAVIVINMGMICPSLPYFEHAHERFGIYFACAGLSAIFGIGGLKSAIDIGHAIITQQNAACMNLFKSNIKLCGVVILIMTLMYPVDVLLTKLFRVPKNI